MYEQPPLSEPLSPCPDIVLLLALACHANGLAGTAAARQVPASTVDKVPPPALTATSITGGGGLRLTLYEGGKAAGPPIVFIHGFTGSYLSWERQLFGPLAAEFRLLAYDLRGHGASDKPLDSSNYTDVTLWAVDLIRFGGHLPKGGYDVQTNGRQSQAAAQAPAVRC